MNHPEELLLMDRQEKAGIHHPSHPFLFLTFLFDQVHQRVAVQDPLGPFILLIGPVGQKDHSLLPLAIVHDEGSCIARMIQPVPL